MDFDIFSISKFRFEWANLEQRPRMKLLRIREYSVNFSWRQLMSLRDSRPEKGENVHHVECFFITISIFVPEIYDLKKYSFVEKVWIVQKRVTLMLFHVGASRKVCVVFLVSCRHWFSLLETRKTDRSLSRVKRQTWRKGHWDLRVFLSTASTWLFRWSHPEKRTEF